MRLLKTAVLLLFLLLSVSGATLAADKTVKLTVYVEGVNRTGGNIGVLLFRNDKGWPENNDAAFRRVVVPAHPGTVVVEVPDIPAGDYAVAVGHDTNVNHHVDKNWMGKPTEQWGMSNNPRALLKAPAFSRARFSLPQSAEIHIQLQ
jgi:uncharacterized protein (DUF2141 family)